MRTVNAKFEVGNRIIKVARWYTLIRVFINFILGTLFVVLSYTLPKDGKIIWPYFWTGLGFYIETILVWVFRYFLYGFGILVCDSAYNLSKNRVVTYLDYIEAKRLHSKYKINQEEMEKIELEYVQNDSGLVE